MDSSVCNDLLTESGEVSKVIGFLEIFYHDQQTFLGSLFAIFFVTIFQLLVDKRSMVSILERVGTSCMDEEIEAEPGLLTVSLKTPLSGS